MSVPLIDVERAEFSNRRWLVCHSERQAVKLVPNFDRLEECSGREHTGADAGSDVIHQAAAAVAF